VHSSPLVINEVDFLGYRLLDVYIDKVDTLSSQNLVQLNIFIMHGVMNYKINVDISKI